MFNPAPRPRLCRSLLSFLVGNPSPLSILLSKGGSLGCLLLYKGNNMTGCILRNPLSLFPDRKARSNNLTKPMPPQTKPTPNVGHHVCSLRAPGQSRGTPKRPAKQANLCLKYGRTIPTPNKPDLAPTLGNQAQPSLE